MASNVFNNSIGSPYDFYFPNLTEQQKREILADLFEQLMLFDKVTINTNRLNFQLVFLIDALGINKVEELIDRGTINFLLWTPMIVTSSGSQRKDGTIDESTVCGQPPLVGGVISDSDLNPEDNIDKALSHFGFHRDRRRIFTRLASKNYIIPNGMEYSTTSAQLVIDSYKNNNLSYLGLPYNKEPAQLSVPERLKLLALGNKVLETSIISKYNYKSFGSLEHFNIYNSTLTNIGGALKVTNATSEIFRIMNIPDLKKLYLTQKLDFNTVFNLRYQSNARYFRKWINEVTESADAHEISREYFNQITGKNNFFETTGGKLLKYVSSYTIGALLDAKLIGLSSIGATLGLGMLETLVLDDLLKGKNPSMFVLDIEKEMENKN